MFNNKRKIIFNTAGIIFFILILSFTYFRYSQYKIGPEIISINMKKFMDVEKPSLSVDAEIKNTQSVTLNKRNILLHNKKTFHEILVFSPGVNIIEIELKDAFGKDKLYTYSVFYKNKDQNFPKTLKEAKIQKKTKEAEDLLIEVNKQ